MFMAAAPVMPNYIHNDALLYSLPPFTRLIHEPNVEACRITTLLLVIEAASKLTRGWRSGNLATNAGLSRAKTQASVLVSPFLLREECGSSFRDG